MSTTERAAVFAVFADADHARAALVDLEAAKFLPSEVGVVMADRGEARDLEQSAGLAGGSDPGAGALVGGLAGTAVGWLGGIGALAIPGIGPLVGAGAIAAMLGGATAGAGIGALAGALTAAGAAEDEARRYERAVQDGSTLVVVRTAERTTEARQILARHGATVPPD